MNIGIDLDDVLLEFQRGWLKFSAMNFGTTVKYNEVHSFDFKTVFKMDSNIVFERIYDFYRSEDFHDLVPTTGAGEIIDRLKSEDLFIITSRPDLTKESTIKWIDKYFPNSFKDIIFTNQFSNSNNKEKKSDVCKRLSIDVMIEDAPPNIYDLCSCKINTILMDRPWNQSIRNSSNVFRVRSWYEVPDVIDKFNDQTTFNL